MGIVVYQREGDAFERGQRAAKGVALLDVVHTHLQHCCGGPHAGRANKHPRRREPLHSIIETTVHLTHHMTMRQAHLLQGKPAGRDAHPSHVLKKRRRDARHVLEGEGKEGKSSVRGRRIGVGAGQQQMNASHLQ